MDSKILQSLIYGIVNSGEYTLEGIAYHTRIPLDILLDAVCGKANEFSITLWARIAELYIQVKPEISQILLDRLQKIKDAHCCSIATLLDEG